MSPMTRVGLVPDQPAEWGYQDRVQTCNELGAVVGVPRRRRARGRTGRRQLVCLPPDRPREDAARDGQAIEHLTVVV